MNQSIMSQNLVDLGKQLLEACKNGEVDEVKSLMNSGAPFTTDWLGASPLHFAAANGHSDVIDVLLRAGVSRDTRTKVDRTPLHVAAQEGHLEIVNLLVNHGADVDAKDLLRMTPLHWAVERGFTDVAEALLNHGADPDVQNKFDKTPLDIALDSAQDNMAQLLQRFTSNPGNSSRSKSGQHEASKAGNSGNKPRPIVLPNKATRTTKVKVSNVHHGGSSGSGLVSGGNIHKVILNNKGGGSISLETLNRLLGNNSDSTQKFLANIASLTQSDSNRSNQQHQLVIDDPVEWLQSQGVNMKKEQTSDSLVNSALEGGHKITLTEAGKLTLNAMKSQNSATSSSGQQSSNNNLNLSGKKITILSSSATRIPHVVQNNSNSSGSKQIMVVNSTNAGKSSPSSSPVRKTIKIATLPKNLSVTRNASGQVVISPTKTSLNQQPSSVVIDGDQEDDDEEEIEEEEVVPVQSNRPSNATEVGMMSLRKELMSCRRQLQEAKSTIQEKDQELERLKTLLKEKGIKF